MTETQPQTDAEILEENRVMRLRSINEWHAPWNAARRAQEVGLLTKLEPEEEN